MDLSNRVVLRSYDLERLSVLVVDDNRHMLTLLKTILHGLGIKKVREATDGAEAFKELRYTVPDIAIVDWAMSPLDGMDFLRLVRTAKDSPDPYLPIIMLTGHTETHRVREARDIGVNEFLGKPVSARAVYDRIVEVIENPRPFIRTARYFGPDRRRQNPSNYNGPERRKENLLAETDGELSQNDVDALLAKQWNKELTR